MRETRAGAPSGLLCAVNWARAGRGSQRRGEGMTAFDQAWDLTKALFTREVNGTLCPSRTA